LQISRLFRTLAIACLLLHTAESACDEIQVAAASNFAAALKSIVSRFEMRTGHKVRLILGSTGKLYAQIRHGAPFDAFFAADVARPERLEREGAAQSGSRFTYAVGKVVLWSPRAGYVDAEGRVLEQGGFRRLAIANPKLAPYGRAAREVLQAYGLWGRLQGTLVRGENIGQTFQFVKSGNVELGLVANSQVKRPGHPIEGSMWEVPQSLYSPIEQQAVLLSNSEVARAFLAFVKGDESLAIIRGFGYAPP